MELYSVFWQLLAWSITVAVLGFLTFPWGILAYKIWFGNKEIDEELSEQLLVRSWYAGWALAAAAVLICLLDYVTVARLNLPAGPVHMIYYLGLLGVAAWMM